MAYVVFDSTCDIHKLVCPISRLVTKHNSYESQHSLLFSISGKQQKQGLSGTQAFLFQRHVVCHSHMLKCGANQHLHFESLGKSAAAKSPLQCQWN